MHVLWQSVILLLFFSALRNHVLAVHEKLKPFLCDICGYAASAKANLVSSPSLASIRANIHRWSLFSIVLEYAPNIFRANGLFLNGISKLQVRCYLLFWNFIWVWHKPMLTYLLGSRNIMDLLVSIENETLLWAQTFSSFQITGHA